MTEHIPVTKCENDERPIPTEWRKTLANIVECLASGDSSRLRRLLPDVSLTDDEYSDIERYIRSYGCTLTNLTDETWKTSVYGWMRGYWHVLVDLCTVEEGISDLVLFVRVYPRDASYAFEIESVHVP